MEAFCDECGEPVEFDLPNPDHPGDNGVTHESPEADEECDNASHSGPPFY